MLEDDEILSELGGDDDVISDDDELGEDGLPKKEGLDGGLEEDDDLEGEV